MALFTFTSPDGKEYQESGATKEEAFSRVQAKLGEQKPPQAKQIVPLDVPSKGADFLSLSESFRADDPQTQMNILAENRFPNLSEAERSKRYKMTPKGPAYQAEDKKWYLSRPSGFLAGTKEFGASMLGHAESVGGSGYGAFAGTMAGGPIGGMLGAGLGGAAGEALRKIQAGAVYGEPQTPLGNIGAMSEEAAWAAGGEGFGQLAGKYLTRRAVRDLDRLDPAVVGRLTSKAERTGIPLTPAEKTNLRDLLNQQALLRDLPESSAIMEDFLKYRNTKVQRAVYDYLGNLSDEATPAGAYQKGIRAAQEGRERLVTRRKATAAPFYKEAGPQPLDINPVIEGIEAVMPDFKGTAIGGKLARIQNALKGKETAGAAHNVKMDLDDVIEAAKRKGKLAQVRQLQTVKESLLETIEEQVPEYRTGREAFRRMSEPITELDESLAGEAIKQAEKIAPNLGNTLFGKASSPQAIRQARKLITAYNPEAWDAVVRGHLQQTFEEMAESSIGEAGNIGGMYRKKIFGSMAKKSMLKNALSTQQYQSLNDLMDVLQATGRAFKGQSITAQRQVMIGEMKDEAMAGIPKATRLLRPSKILEAWEDVRMGKYSETLARIITDPEGMTKLKTQLKKLRQIKPRTQAWMNALGASWATIIGAE